MHYKAIKAKRTGYIGKNSLRETFETTSSKQMPVKQSCLYHLYNVNALRAISFLWIFFIDIEVLQTNPGDTACRHSLLTFGFDHLFCS